MALGEALAPLERRLEPLERRRARIAHLVVTKVELLQRGVVLHQLIGPGSLGFVLCSICAVGKFRKWIMLWRLMSVPWSSLHKNLGAPVMLRGANVWPGQ